ncbi:hypothetical protein P8H26_13650 [Pseudochrobactrum sp. sp1633]|uniref:hypothetical protein n=1 Tax=Pseudochrobactrum sp. sp1633 TaxID=3036706 RepID=UPI0025A5C866|nr:hypothetical protein [Pseudochrobactrum sp. sp1633]MDM8346438.1 hypothetical protein [Pseudochrobactrum sp. sp1633]
MAELRAYNPSLRDRIARMLLGDGKPSETKRRVVLGALGSTGLGNDSLSVSDFTPLGMVLSGDEAIRSAQNGNYGGAALNALGALPGGVVTAGVAKGAKAVDKSGKFASRTSKLYDDIPDLPQRPFEMDYPNGAQHDNGRLLTDIEGRPLTAPRIAGRTSLGASEVALTPREVRSIGEEITGRPVQFRNGGVGEEDGLASLHFDQSGTPVEITLQRGLTQQQYNEVLPHEVGHAIDLTAGRIPFNEQEAAANYSQLLRVKHPDGRIATPQDVGYEDFEAPYELSAEAIRAYMSNPNYFKTVAPKTAASIREYVNTHPKLKNIIQFNSVAAAGGAGALAMSGTDQAEAASMDTDIIEVELPDGTIAEFPAGTSQDVMRTALMKQFGQSSQITPEQADPRDSFLGKVDSVMRGAADTLSFGFSDEIAAGLGTGFGYLGDYDQELARQRGIDQSDSDERFGYRLGGQITGGVTGGVGLAKSGVSLGANAINAGKSLGKVALASGVEGATLGGLHGFGSGEGVDGRALNGSIGLAGGGIIGAAAPAAIAGVSGVVKPYLAQAGAMINPEKYAAKALGDGVRRSGSTADKIAAMLTGSQADDQGMFTVADAMGHSGQRMLSTVARNPSEMRQTVVDTLTQRQMGQGERLSQFLADGFDATDTAAQRAASLTAQQKAAATVNYGAAREAAGTVDPTSAIQAADDFLMPGASRVMNPGNNIADDSIESAVRRARSYLTDGNSILTDFNAALRSKQEIDAMIEGAKPAVQCQLIPIRNSLDEALGNASEPYAAARNTFRQQSQAIDAVEQGKNAASSRMRAGDTIPQFNKLAPDAQDAFRAGYADPLITKVESASMSPTTNKARALVTEKTGQEFPVFAAAGKADQLGARIAREQRMFDTANTALGGSKTADNLADAAELSKLDPSIVSTLMRGRPFAAAAQGIGSLLNAGRGQPKAVSELIAKALLETDPEVARKLLDTGSRQLTKSETHRALVNAITGNLGAAGVARLGTP